jgi:hypothetical protein
MVISDCQFRAERRPSRCWCLTLMELRLVPAIIGLLVAVIRQSPVRTPAIEPKSIARRLASGLRWTRGRYLTQNRAIRLTLDPGRRWPRLTEEERMRPSLRRLGNSPALFLTSRLSGVDLVRVLRSGRLLRVVAASLAFSMRVTTIFASSYVNRVRDQVLAEAGMRRRILALFEPDALSRRRPDDSVQGSPFGLERLRIAVTSDNGKIDLNAARDSQIYKPFVSVAGATPSLSPMDTTHLADAVLDWRESDGRLRLRAAGGEVSPTDSLQRGGRNGAFSSAGNFGQVTGMKPEIPAAMTESVTELSRTPGVDPSGAPGRFLLAIPGHDGDRVEQCLAARDVIYNSDVQYRGQPLSLPLEPLTPGTRQLSRAELSDLTVDADGVMAAGSSMRRKAVVRGTGIRTRLFSVLTRMNSSIP